MRQARSAAIAGVVAAMLAAGAPARAEPQPAAQAWQSMSTHAPQLRPALGAALEAIPSRAPLAGIFRAEQQMLGDRAAYRVIVVLADRSKWRVTLVPHADGGMQASAVEPVP